MQTGKQAIEAAAGEAVAIGPVTPIEQTLRAGEELLHTLFESSLDAVLLVTLDGEVLAANPAAQKMFGQSEDDLRQTGWRNLIDTSEPRFKAALAQHQEYGRFSGELTFIDKDGQRFPGELSSSGLTGPDGARLTSVIVRDISERRHIENLLIASEKRYAALFRDASDPILIADEHGILEEANSSFAALLGYETGELIGMSVGDIHPAREMERVRQSFAEIFRTGQIAPVETCVVCKDGTEIEVEIRPTLAKIGGRTVAQGIFIDLTERKRLEQRRLKEERAHRDALVREVHHRIKNNLQSVAGLLRRELGRFVELDPRLETAISQVHATAVVHGLQGDNSEEEVRLCDCVSNICKSIFDVSQRNVRFVAGQGHAGFVPVRIESSEAVAVALVVNELILNAVKHSPDGRDEPTVSLDADGDSACITIRNAVADVPEFDIDTGAGLGTGLRLVRSLLPAQGAQLTYEPDADGYLLTTLRLDAPVVTSLRHGGAD